MTRCSKDYTQFNSQYSIINKIVFFMYIFDFFDFLVLKYWDRKHCNTPVGAKEGKKRNLKAREG